MHYIGIDKGGTKIAGGICSVHFMLILQRAAILNLVAHKMLAFASKSLLELLLANTKMESHTC
jgi:hypothetical protein